jgi:hypothetical protein
MQRRVAAFFLIRFRTVESGVEKGREERGSLRAMRECRVVGSGPFPE